MNAKRKGNAFERQVCKQLSLWWSGGTAEDLFWRTSNSGGRATTRAKADKATRNAHGDICATDPSAQPFVDLICVELKIGYSGDHIHALLDLPLKSPLPTYGKWITKIRNTAKAAGVPYWMLITKRDRREALVLLDVLLWNYLDMDAMAGPPPTIIECDFLPRFGVCRMSRFLELVHPELVCIAAKRYKS